MSLEDLRESAAQAAYTDYDFGSSEVEDHSGWEYTVPGDEWTRTIFLRSETPGGATDRGHFTVVFEKGTAVVSESYGMFNGNILAPASAPSP